MCTPSILFGTALSTTASGATVAATTGLFGSGGFFALGTTISTVGSALGVAGALFGGAQSAANLDFQAGMLERDAKIKETNAILAERQAAQEADLYDDRYKLFASKVQTGFAKGNVLINQDTPLEIAVANEELATAERLAILHGGAVRASAERVNAQGFRGAAGNARANIPGVRFASVLSAGAAGSGLLAKTV
jgi:hypothetical protein